MLVLSFVILIIKLKPTSNHKHDIMRNNIHQNIYSYGYVKIQNDLTMDNKCNLKHEKMLNIDHLHTSGAINRKYYVVHDLRPLWEYYNNLSILHNKHYTTIMNDDLNPINSTVFNICDQCYNILYNKFKIINDIDINLIKKFWNYNNINIDNNYPKILDFTMYDFEIDMLKQE